MFNNVIYNILLMIIKKVSAIAFWLVNLFGTLIINTIIKIKKNKTLKNFITNTPNFINNWYNIYLLPFVQPLTNYILYEMKLKEDFTFIANHIKKFYYLLKNILMKFYKITKLDFIVNLVIQFILFISNYIITICVDIYLVEKQNTINFILRWKRRVNKFLILLLKAFALYIELWIYKTLLIWSLYLLNYDTLTINWVNKRWNRFNLSLFFYIKCTMYILGFLLLIILLQSEDTGNYFKYRFPEEMSLAWSDALLIPVWKHLLECIQFSVLWVFKSIQILFTPIMPIINFFYKFIDTILILVSNSTTELYNFINYWLNLNNNAFYINDKMYLLWFNSSWDYILITTILIYNLITLVLVLKTWDCSKNFNKYQFSLGFIYTVLNSWILLNDSNSLFLFILIILTELTSIFLLSIILLNYISEKKIKTSFNIWWLLSLVFLISSTTSYTYFNYYNSLYAQPNPLINFTYICYTTHSYTLIVFIIILTWLILLLLYNFKKQPINYNILYIWSSTKTFINQIIDNLNILCEPFINKWNYKK